MKSIVCFPLCLLTLLVPLSAKPLKVYILAGQSNMEGHAKIETFDYMSEDPATAPLLDKMLGPDGAPRVCDDVWISYYTGRGENNGEGFGKLTSGYGARGNPEADGGKIGPEFTFGIRMGEALEEPVLIIKTAWGGKSLHTDFRPPSAGPYELSDWQKENYPKQEGHGIPKDFEKWKEEKAEATGRYYRLMMEHIQRILDDPGRICPDYNKNDGYEIAGFVWFQGWNDMVDSHTYPHNAKPQRFSLYSELLATFIRDVRKDLSEPDMPFVIGVMGVSGKEAEENMQKFRDAMAAPASMPEFSDNVAAVHTADYWDETLEAIARKKDKVRAMSHALRSKNKNHANKDGTMSDAEQREYLKNYEAELISPEEVAQWKSGTSNAAYHYLGSAKIIAQIGNAFAEAMLKLQGNAAPKAEYRTFENTAGVSMKARLLEVKGNRISLERSDGRTFHNVPLESFSEEDIEYIKNWMR